MHTYLKVTIGRIEVIITNRFQELRKSRNLTQEQLAKTLGIKRENVSRWENGIAEPNRKNLIKLAKFYDVTTDYLLKIEEDTA